MSFHKTKVFSAALICLTFLTSLVFSAEMRTWTSASDPSQTFEAKLLNYNDYTGMITVDRGDRRLTFSQDVLSAQDIEYVKAEGPKLEQASSPARGGSASVSGSIPDQLPDPDGKEANMRKPVQVFVLMGQSNMLGFGKVSQLKGIAADKYPYLVDDAGNWNVRKDVRNVFFNNGTLDHNDWMAADNRKNNFRPEIGIGNYLGHVIDAPVLILKACVGNRALGWDLLPPSAVGTGANGQSYQGDSEYGDRKVKSDRQGWYAGLQYDLDVGVAQDALEKLSTYYPDATEYEVAGFFWWQGCSEGKGSVENYDKNLAFLFSYLKKDFNAPNAKFICATLGEDDKDATLSQKMFNFAKENKDAEVFYSKPVSTGGSCSHYSGNAETYMNVGEGMGKKMIELLSGK
jgi:hypothetical protein